MRTQRTVLLLLCVLSWSLCPDLAPGQSPDYVLRPVEAEGPPGDTVTVPVLLDHPNGEPLQGLSFSVCHEQTEVTLTDAVEGTTVETVKNGDPADFVTVNLYPDGVAFGMVVCFTGCAVVEPGVDLEMVRADYLLAPAPAGTVSVVSVCATIGSPPVEAVVVTQNMATIIPTTLSADIIIDTGAEFRRGDANGDGVFSGLPDGFFILAFQFIPGSPAPPCMKAADVNDDGTVAGLSDGVAALNFQFVIGSAPPPPPGAFTCGPDPTLDLLECDTSPCP